MPLRTLTGQVPAMDQQTSLQLVTPHEAARIVGCGRSSIMRALDTKKLPATRGNRNAWLIRREDLNRWSETRPLGGPVIDLDTNRTLTKTEAGQGPDHEAVMRLAAAEARADTLAAQVADLRQERDRLLALVERLTERQAQQEARPASPRVGFLSRLLGHGRASAT